MTAKPPDLGQDRSKWRYEDGGAAFEAAKAFHAWMAGLPEEPDAGERLTTRVSWPQWKGAIPGGRLQQFAAESSIGLRVRYPADGMAYVFCLLPNSDSTLDLVVGLKGPEQRRLEVLTLLLEAGEWRVHQVGRMPPPRTLGLTPYSW